MGIKFKEMTTVFIGLGSNIGNRMHYLHLAREGLSNIFNAKHTSSIIESAPLYVTDQPAFLNQVISGETSLSITDLFNYITQLQKEIGRTLTYKNGPREIDIDILYYGNTIMDTPDITVPHPRINERLFVLEPICEIAPDWLCPITKKTMRELLLIHSS